MTFPIRRWAPVLPVLLAAACGTAVDRALERERARLVFGPSLPGAEAGTGEPAQDPAAITLDETSTADDYVLFGLRRNPSVRAAFEDWRAALQKVPQVGELPDPRLTYAHFVESIQTRTGPQRNRFGVSQAFPFPGTLAAREEVASRRAEARWHEVEARRLEVERRIRRAFYDYAWLARRRRITSDNLELLRGFEPVVQTRIQGGAPQAELLQLQVEIGKLEDELAGIDRMRPALSARLDALIDRRGGDVLPLPGLPVPEHTEVPAERARAAMRRTNPELHALLERVRAERAGAELAEAEGWPDFTVGTDYIDTGSALNPGTPGSGDDPWVVSLGMTLPLYRGRYDAMEAEAERRTAAAGQRLADRDNALTADLEMALYRLDDAARQVVLYRDSLLPRARQSLQVTDTAYRGGEASLLDLIDQQRVLLAFENAFWRACASWGRARADLDALTGGALR